MRPVPVETDADLATVLLLAVARLGEADQAAWWRSHGLSSTGRYILSSAFPRTWAPAGLELDIICATWRQEELLGGRETALHLFSDQLPFRRVALAWLAERKSREPDPLVTRLQEVDEGELRTLLAKESGSGAGKGEAIGAGLLLGRLSRAELDDSDVLTAVVKSLAGAYVDQGPELRPPYFDLS